MRAACRGGAAAAATRAGRCRGAAAEVAAAAEPPDVYAGAEQPESPDVCAGLWDCAFASFIYVFMRSICFDSFGTWVTAGPVSASNGLRIAEKSKSLSSFFKVACNMINWF